MAEYEDIYRVKYEFENEEKIAQQSSALGKAEQALRDLMATQRAMGASGGQMTSMIEDQARAIHDLRVELEAAKRVAADFRAANSKPITIVDPTPVFDVVPGKGFDPKRAASKARLGMGALNTAQDMIQGGPASGINNVLGMMGDQGIKSLTGEWLAMAGGIGTVTAAIGGFVAAAGAGFLVIDHALSSSKVGWGDLSDVVDNIFGGAVSQAGKNMSDTLSATLRPLGELTNQALDYWLGWDDATAKVRDHKAEIEKTSASLAKYGDAMKVINSVKSDDQKVAEARNKRAGEELAALGGEKGAGGVLDKLVWARVGSDAARKETREVNETKDGKPDGTPTGNTVMQTKTKGEWARMAAAEDLAAALQGNEEKRARILEELKAEGNDVSRVEQTIKGRNFDEEEKTAKAQAERVKKREEREKLIDEATRTQSWKGWDEGDLTPEEREAKARFDKQLREAQKSKEFLRLDDADMTPAELEAKRQFDAHEAQVKEASRNRAWLNEDGEMRDDDALTPAELDAKRRAEKDDRRAEKALAEAQKTRSFLGKDTSEMTGAELEAKRLHDERERQVAESLASESWLGKESEELTPAEAIAKRRAEEDERKRKGRATESSRVADERRREQTRAPGLDDFIRDAIIQGASQVDVDKQLMALGIDAKGRNELISEGTRNAYGKRLADMEDMASRQSQVFTSGAQLRDSIQAGVKGDDLPQKQLQRLEAIERILTEIERQPNYAVCS